MYSPTIPSRLVKLFTKYKYSHVGICLSKDCETIYSFGRKSLHNFFNDGFTIENKNMPFYVKFKQTICRIYELEISLAQYQKIKEKLEYMEQNSKMYKYDFLGIF